MAEHDLEEGKDGARQPTSQPPVKTSQITSGVFWGIFLFVVTIGIAHMIWGRAPYFEVPERALEFRNEGSLESQEMRRTLYCERIVRLSLYRVGSADAAEDAKWRVEAIPGGIMEFASEEEAREVYEKILEDMD